MWRRTRRRRTTTRRTMTRRTKTRRTRKHGETFVCVLVSSTWMKISPSANFLQVTGVRPCGGHSRVVFFRPPAARGSKEMMQPCPLHLCMPSLWVRRCPILPARRLFGRAGLQHSDDATAAQCYPHAISSAPLALQRTQLCSQRTRGDLPPCRCGRRSPRPAGPRRCRPGSSSASCLRKTEAIRAVALDDSPCLRAPTDLLYKIKERQRKVEDRQ